MKVKFFFIFLVLVFLLVAFLTSEEVSKNSSNSIDKEYATITSKKLIEKINSGIKINEPSKKICDLGMNPLLFAVYYGRIDLVKILLENGADPNFRQFGHHPVLELALQWRLVEVVDLLLINGANANDYDVLQSSKTRLSIIEKEVMRYSPDHTIRNILKLVKHGANINETMCYGSILFVASAYNVPCIVFETLMSCNADIFKIDSNEEDLLHKLIDRSKYNELCKKYFINRLNLNCISKVNKQTTLTRALYANNTPIIKPLIDNGAWVNLKNLEGKTPLIVAVLTINDVSTIKLLLNSGADSLLTDAKGFTALDYAIKLGKNKTIINILESHYRKNQEEKRAGSANKE
jgi:ankyrin repeat protein